MPFLTRRFLRQHHGRKHGRPPRSRIEARFLVPLAIIALSAFVSVGINIAALDLLNGPTAKGARPLAMDPANMEALKDAIARMQATGAERAR